LEGGGVRVWCVPYRVKLGNSPCIIYIFNILNNIYICTKLKSCVSESEGVRGRLHVSDSAYELPYDSVHDLTTKGLGFRLSLGHQFQLLHSREI
jgi:hypothetical protein